MVKVFNFDDNPNEFSANTYVIGKIGGSCIVVDMGSTKDNVLDYISSHYENVEAVLLTHGHFDHIRGLTKFLKRFKNVPVYMAEEDYSLLSNPNINSSNITGEKVVVNVSPIFVEDDKTIELKHFKFKTIKTPYHTQGSVCYLFEDDNALFTGDSLFKGSIGRTDLETSTPETLPYSLKKIASLNEYLVIYPGHGPISRLDIEKKENPFLIEVLK